MNSLFIPRSIFCSFFEKYGNELTRKSPIFLSTLSYEADHSWCVAAPQLECHSIPKAEAAVGDTPPKRNVLLEGAILLESYSLLPV